MTFIFFFPISSRSYVCRYINAIIFGTYGTVSRYLTSKFPAYHSPSTRVSASSQASLSFTPAVLHSGSNAMLATAQVKVPSAPSITDVSMPVAFASGALAGLTSSVANTPVELLKCRAQIELTHGANTADEINPWRCARNIVRNHGLLGLFTGFRANLIRDGPAYGLYFLTYERMCQLWGVSDHVSTKGINYENLLKINVAGGVAGVVGWLPTQPFDLIKARLQTQSLSNPVYSGVIDCWRKIVAQEGIKGLFRGLIPALMQAAPVSAVTFLTYELTVIMLTPQESRDLSPPAAHIR